MPNYICPRCNYSTKIKTHLLNHLRRKFPCKIVNKCISIEECIDELKGNKNANVNANVNNVNVLSEKYKKNIRNVNVNVNNVNANVNGVNASVNAKNNNFIQEHSAHICENCHKSFSSRQSKYQHKKFCRNISKLEKKIELDKILEIIRLMEERLSAKDMIAGEQGQIEVLLKNQGSNNNTTNQYILINSLGNENTSYITPKIVNNLIGGPLTTISKLSEYIHFNPQYKENHNVKIQIKTKYAQIYSGKGRMRDKKGQSEIW